MEPLSPAFVIRIKLDPSQGDPREQIRRKTCDLPPGIFVRVQVNGVHAIGYGIPFVTRTDFDWYRRDLRWTFSGSHRDSRAVLSWLTLVRELENS